MNWKFDFSPDTSAVCRVSEMLYIHSGDLRDP